MISQQLQFNPWFYLGCGNKMQPALKDRSLCAPETSNTAILQKLWAILNIPNIMIVRYTEEALMTHTKWCRMSKIMTFKDQQNSLIKKNKSSVIIHISRLSIFKMLGEYSTTGSSPKQWSSTYLLVQIAGKDESYAYQTKRICAMGLPYVATRFYTKSIISYMFCKQSPFNQISIWYFSTAYRFN